MHLLKQEFQAEKRSASWEITIKEQRRRVIRLLDETPSLESLLPEIVAAKHQIARKDAARETGLPVSVFPSACPYSINQLVGAEG